MEQCDRMERGGLELGRAGERRFVWSFFESYILEEANSLETSIYVEDIFGKSSNHQRTNGFP